MYFLYDMCVVCIYICVCVFVCYIMTFPRLFLGTDSAAQRGLLRGRAPERHGSAAVADRVAGALQLFDRGRPGIPGLGWAGAVRSVEPMK